MKSYQFVVVEARVYLTKSEMEPVVAPTWNVIAEGDKFRDLCLKIKEWLSEVNGTVVEFSPEAQYVKVDLENVVLECEFASESGSIWPKDAEDFETICIS